MTFAEEIAARLKAASETLVNRWLDLIALHSPLDKLEIFPGSDLIDHVPLLIEGIAAHVANPPVEVRPDEPIMAKAIELGRLRYQQGFDALQILKENEILGLVLFDFLVEQADNVSALASLSEVLVCTQRVFRSIALIQQHTTKGFLELNENRVAEREQRLRSFNRMVSHELKNRMGTALAATEILRHEPLRPESERYIDLIARSLRSLNATTQDLIQLTHSTEPGDRAARSDELPALVQRVMPELQDFARQRHVRIELADPPPQVLVPAVAAELALRNLVNNACKYRDDTNEDRWVRIEFGLREGKEKCELELRVRDNGIGVSERDRTRLFDQFFRADGARSQEEGLGLGLAIVRETLEAQGGRIWAEFPDRGTTFVVVLPCTVVHPNG